MQLTCILQPLKFKLHWQNEEINNTIDKKEEGKTKTTWAELIKHSNNNNILWTTKKTNK